MQLENLEFKGIDLYILTYDVDNLYFKRHKAYLNVNCHSIIHLTSLCLTPHRTVEV